MGVGVGVGEASECVASKQAGKPSGGEAARGPARTAHEAGAKYQGKRERTSQSSLVGGKVSRNSRRNKRASVSILQPACHLRRTREKRGKAKYLGPA